ncbi:ABC transporter substrate-binding protein [Desulfocurvus sp. DL9XJH121]
MKRMSVLALLAVCLLAAAPALAETIKIGAVLSVTGPASFLGEPEKETLLMLQDKINAAGGVLGKQIEVIVYDDETDVNKCVLAADKLIKKDRVAAVVGPSVSGNTLAIMNKFPRAHIPLVSCSASEKIIKPVNPWVFKTPQSDRQAVAAILKHAKAAGYSKIAALTVSNGYGQSGRAVLGELVPAAGMELVADEVYGPKDTDMTAQLTKIKGLGPDAIVCWGTNPGPAVVAMNRVQLGMDTPLYMSHGVASRKFIELAGEACEGLLLPAGRMIDVAQIPDGHPQKPVLAEYEKDYKAACGKPLSTFGGYAYDGLMLLVGAMKAAGSAEPQAIRDSLEATTGYVGATAVYSFSPTDHNGVDESAFVMVRIENQDWKVLE